MSGLLDLLVPVASAAALVVAALLAARWVLADFDRAMDAHFAELESDPSWEYPL